MKKLLLILVLFTMSLSIVACSSDGDKEQDTEAKSESSGITIEHENGKTTLEKPAERVVALEWIYGEEMLALGEQPVGMTDIEGYEQWVNTGEYKLDEGVADLGTRGSANLEDIAALNPDLIVTADYYEYDYDLLNEIAPTIVLSPYPGESNLDGEYDHMISSIEIMGKVLGLEDKSSQVINNLDKAYGQAREKIKESDVNTEYIELIDFSTNDTTSMYLFTDTSIHTSILENLGFKNMYEAPKFELYGQTNINVENLIGLDDNTLFVVADEGEDVFNKDLISQDILDELDFYKNDNIYYLGKNASPFGPLSTISFVDTVVEVVTENE